MFNITTLDSTLEGILWVKFEDKLSKYVFMHVCATYLQVPLVEGTTQRNSGHPNYSLQRNGPLLHMRGLQRKIWNLDDGCHQNSEIPERRVIDREHNTHGKKLLNLLRSLGLCTLNGRGRENSTHISTTGSSVVDYCIVDAEDYNRYSSFAVKTMCEIIQTLDYNEVSHIPDQSLLTWHMDLEGVDVNSIHPHGPKQPP